MIYFYLITINTQPKKQRERDDLILYIFMSFRTYVRNLYSWAWRFLPLVEMTGVYKTRQ